MSTIALTSANPCADISSKSNRQTGFLEAFKRFANEYVERRSEHLAYQAAQFDPRTLHDLRIARDRQDWRQPDC